MGEEQTNEYSRLGTAAHEVAEQCLVSGTDAWTFIDQTIKVDHHDIVIDADTAQAVQVYLNYCRSLYDPSKPTKKFCGYVEQQFIVSQEYDCWGTSDFGAIVKKALYVVDYKNGGGVVEVENNAQLLSYACGSYDYVTQEHKMDPKFITMVIVQPNAWHPDGPIRPWTIPIEKLIEWRSQVLEPALARAEQAMLFGDGDKAQGSWCHYCPASAVCPLINKDLADADAVEEPLPKGISDSDLAVLVAKAQRVKKALGSWERELFKRLQKRDIPGFKLVSKRADRVWKDWAKVEETLGKDAWVKKQITPNQAERLPGGKKLVAQNAEKPVAGLTMAPEDDTRPAAERRDPKKVFASVMNP
jgi:hypothetical protein